MPKFREKRPFTRLSFTAPASITQSEEVRPAEVQDISLKGALLSLPSTMGLKDERPLDLVIHLDDQVDVEMHCRIVRREDERLGLACLSIDLESIQHLRQIIESTPGNRALELDRPDLMLQANQ